MEDFLNYHGLGHFKERDDDRYIRKNEVYDIPWMVDETTSFSDDDLVLIGKITDKGMYATTVSNLLGGVDLNSIIGDTNISGIGDGTVTGAIKSISNELGDYLLLSGGTLTGRLNINTSNSNGLYFTQTGSSGSAEISVEQTWSNNHISLHIGSGGSNRGIYDDINSAWIVYKDENNAVHLGSSTVGSSSTPIYLSSGIPTACSLSYLSLSGGTLTGTLTMSSNILFSGYGRSIRWPVTTGTIGLASQSAGENVSLYYQGSSSTGWDSSVQIADTSGVRIVVHPAGESVGNGTHPVYISGGGVATVSGSTVGSGTRPMYLSEGAMTASSSNAGGTAQPVYLNSGTITACGYSFTNYLPLTGGTLTGSLTVNNNNLYISYSSATPARIVISNSKGSARFSVDADGYPGIYDENVNGGQWVVRSHHNFLPSATESYSIGSGTYLWNVVHVKGATIGESDGRVKTNINDIDERYENLFMKLHPVNYMWKNFRETDNHDRVHCGLIAQEVEESCEEVGLSSMTFAALCHDELDEENYQGLTEIYGLAYGELNGLEIHMIQKCLNKIEELENKIAELESA